MPLSAIDIIAAFDRCVEYHWGKPREFVHRSDQPTAEKWIAAGADLVGCVIVFHERMSWMVEKRGRRNSQKPSACSAIASRR